MQITLPREATRAALHAAALLAPKRTTGEILKSVLLRAWEGAWQFLATDTELSLTVPFAPAQVTGHPAILLPPARALAVLHECPAQDITLTIDNDLCRFAWGQSWIELACQQPGEFASKLVCVDAPETCGVVARDFRRLLHRTTYATDEDSTRYALGGVLLEWSNGELVGAATDSRRLAVATSQSQQASSDLCHNPVLPGRAATLLAQLLPETDEPVLIAFEGTTRFRVDWSGGSLAGLTVQGRFPDWRKVLPKSGPYEMTAVAGPLLRALKTVNTCPEGEHKCDLELRANELVLKAGEGLNSSKVALPVACARGGFKATFDVRYLIDFVRTVEPSNTITLQGEDGESPLLLRDGLSSQYVVMPLSKN